jgi:hypothetical protein
MHHFGEVFLDRGLLGLFFFLLVFDHLFILDVSVYLFVVSLKKHVNSPVLVKVVHSKSLACKIRVESHIYTLSKLILSSISYWLTLTLFSFTSMSVFPISGRLIIILNHGTHIELPVIDNLK